MVDGGEDLGSDIGRSRLSRSAEAGRVAFSVEEVSAMQQGYEARINRQVGIITRLRDENLRSKEEIKRLSAQLLRKAREEAGE